MCSVITTNHSQKQLAHDTGYGNLSKETQSDAKEEGRIVQYPTVEFNPTNSMQTLPIWIPSGMALAYETKKLILESANFTVEGNCL